MALSGLVSIVSSDYPAGALGSGSLRIRGASTASLAKGPIIHDALTIDAEWDCAFKWNRLQPLLTTIVDKTVLDIGSNNGYFTRKFKSAGARYVTGIEPTFIYSMQFIAQHRWRP